MTLSTKITSYDPKVLATLTDAELNQASDNRHIFLNAAHHDQSAAIRGGVGPAFFSVLVGTSGLSLYVYESGRTQEAKTLLQAWEKPDMAVSVNFADSALFRDVANDCFTETSIKHPVYVLSENAETVLESPMASLMLTQEAYTECVTYELKKEADYTPISAPIMAAAACAVSLAMTGVKLRNFFTASRDARRLNNQALALDAEIARRAESTAAAPQPAAQ